MIEDYEKRRLEKPDWMVNRPAIPIELQWYWDAFWELDSERVWSNGLPRSIPWTSIKEYAVYHEVDFDYTLKMVRALDNSMLKYKQQQHDRAMEEEQRRTSQVGKGRKGKRPKRN